MSNKIITFGNYKNSDLSVSNEYKDIVYKDIKMISKPSKNNSCPSQQSQESYEAYLSQESGTAKEEYEYLIYSEYTSEEDKKLLTFYFNEIQDYEEVLRIWKMRSRWMIDNNINITAVQNSLKNIFTWIPGERILNPEFGSNLRTLLYEQITPITEEKIVSEIKSCVSRWEPRVIIEQVINVSDIDDTEDNVIRLDIKYKIIGLDGVYTYTYEQINND